MGHRRSTLSGRTRGNTMKCGLKMALALLCLSLIMGGPHTPLPYHGTVGAGSVSAQTGGAPAGDSTGTEDDDTPSEDDIADFASEYDKDGDGEVDEPEDDEDDEAADEADDEADDDADQEDDQDDDHDDDQEDERDDDFDGQEIIDDDDDSGDSADGREDVDGEASPDFRLSGFNRYPADKKLRRLGEFSGLAPLIEREESLLFEN